MPNDQNSPTESLIAEPLCVRLGIDWTSAPAVTAGINIPAPNRQVGLTPEAKRIAEALIAICNAPPGTTVMWAGRRYTIILAHHANPTKGTQLIGRPGAERAAQIVLAPVDQPEQHNYTKFAVVPNGKPAPGDPPFFLECEGNPTTLMRGNNVLPITARDPKTQEVGRYPSSARKVMTTLNRLLFHFLEEIAAQITGSDADLFEPATRHAINRGDFQIVHIQWCCYFPTDVPRFLQILVALFAPPARTETGFSSLAKQMGLRFDYKTDERSTRVTAVLFEKRYGRNPAWSADFYNKRARISQTKQGKTLGEYEETLIDNNVRFDMTAHGPAIMQIIASAQRALKRHRKEIPTFLEHERTIEFLSGNPQQTARWLEFAIFVLSHRPMHGDMRRGSFAHYLVPKFLDEVLRLRSLVRCTLEGLRAFEKLDDDPVAKAWRELDTYDPHGWAGQLAEATGCKKSKIYEQRATWLVAYNIDIAIPRAFYRDLRTYTPITFALPGARDALLNARDQGDGGETLRLLSGADTSFFEQMNEFVGRAILSPPKLLVAKVAGEITAVPIQPKQAIVSQVASTKAFSRTNSLDLPQKRSSRKPSPRLEQRAAIPDLPAGIDRRSTFDALFTARGAVWKRMQDPSDDEEARALSFQLENVQDLIVSRRAMVKQQKQTRRKNIAAARLKRMGGPLQILGTPIYPSNWPPKE
jgi:hypothetical protein